MRPAATIDAAREEDLAERLQNGDEDALAELYDALGAKVFRLLYRLTRDAELTADLTHDTFVRVMERRHQYRPHGSYAGWVFQIARNLAIDAFRSRQALGLDGMAPVEGRPAPPESRIDLRHALDELPAAYRVVLLLHDADGHTHDEIARMLEIATGTSRARLSRGRALLRTFLDTGKRGHDER